MHECTYGSQKFLADGTSMTGLAVPSESVGPIEPDVDTGQCQVLFGTTLDSASPDILVDSVHFGQH